jgi:tetratricopeptide (TPR) repeat protein
LALSRVAVPTIVLAALSAPVRADRAEERAAQRPLVERALAALHEEDVAAALAACDELKRRWPADPSGHLLEANVHQTRMRDYRTSDFEGEFKAALERALARARLLSRQAPDAQAFFTLGSARGYQAIHRFARGEWFPALREALRARSDMKRAAAQDPTFADPQLALALHDFWKSEKLGLGLGLFGGGRKTVVSRLQTVRREGRFLAVEAAYALATVHLLEQRYDDALRVNAELRERFPHNPVALYHGGLILEALDRRDEALGCWDGLVGRLQAQARPSDGFLAECHLHRARLHAASASSESRHLAAEAAARARDHAARRDPLRELEGPFVRFDEIRRSIARLP